MSFAAALAALERRRQEKQARPAYRNYYLGGAHARLERYARQVLSAARPDAWMRFYAASAADAATVDQCIRYIVRQERPAESARVEWLRTDGSWRAGFPRPLDHRGHGERARMRREIREQLAAADGRDAGTFDAAELAHMARVSGSGETQWYAGRVRLGPKRGTVAPPASPGPYQSVRGLLRRALTGQPPAAE